MGERIQLRWSESRVQSSVLALLESEDRRCLDLSILQCSVIRQMLFPWAKFFTRLVEEHEDYQITVDMPQAYIDALEELELLLGGGYDGPEGGCPVGEIYVDRGDLAGYDFTLATLSHDNAWHDLDLTNVIGEASATRVLIRVTCRTTSAGNAYYLREAGNVAEVNVSGLRIQVANLYVECEGYVHMSVAQHIEYLLSSSLNYFTMVVRGYWRPAA